MKVVFSCLPDHAVRRPLSTSWLQKRKGSKVSISNGGFNLVASAIMWKLLQWAPLISFVIWNGSHGSSQSISFIPIYRDSICGLLHYCSQHSQSTFSSTHCSVCLGNDVVRQNNSVSRIHTDMLSMETCPLFCCGIDQFLIFILKPFLMPKYCKYEHTQLQ